MLMIVSLEYYIASSIRLSCYKSIVDTITSNNNTPDKNVLANQLGRGCTQPRQWYDEFAFILHVKKKRADIIFYCILGAFAILDIAGVIIWIKLF